jgi:hypothetical protein
LTRYAWKGFAIGPYPARTNWLAAGPGVTGVELAAMLRDRCQAAALSRFTSGSDEPEARVLVALSRLSAVTGQVAAALVP